MVMRQGGVTGRPGTQYVGTALNGGNQVRLIPFIFNETGLGQSYVLEFGNGYVTFYQNGENISASGPEIITAITQANPCVVTAANAFADGDIVLIRGVFGMTQLNNGYFIVANRTSTHFSLKDLFGNDINSTSYGSYVSGGTADKIYIVPSPYQQADLASINYAQSADILTLVHPDYPIHELKRFAATSWALVDITTQLNHASIDGPTADSFSGGGSGGSGQFYAVTSVDAQGNETELQFTQAIWYSGSNTPSISQVISFSWVAVTGASSYRIYRSPYGAQPGLTTTGDKVTLGYIGTTIATEFSDDGFAPDYTNIPPFQGQFNTTTDNYPSIVGFCQQRRYFGSTNNNPVGFWGSKPGQYYNYDVHTISPQDDDAISGTLAGEEVNQISAIQELKFMLILTTGSEMYVQGNGSGVVTPSAINASVQSQYGAGFLRPLKAGDQIIFTQSLGTAIRDFAFDFAIDGYRGNDITIFSAHLFEGYQIVDWCYQKVPDSIVWAVRSDGVLLSCTYVREQQVVAWARHDFTDGLVENICSIPENGEYAVYISIKRVINGETVRYIERISSRLWPDTVNTPPVQNDPINASYLDSFLEYDGRHSNSSEKMRLLGGAIIVTAGVNDFLPVGIGPSQTPFYNIQIPAGIYEYQDLRGIIESLLVTTTGIPFRVFDADGQYQFFTSDATSFEFLFGSFPQSFGSYAILGFDYSNYSGGALPGLIAPHSPQNFAFSTTSTAYQQQLILTSNSIFQLIPGAIAVDDQIFLQDEEWIYSQGKKGNQIRLTVQAFHADGVIVTPSGIVPEEFQLVFISNWARAVQTISGLLHLEGLAVSVWADRFVVGSPLNSQVTPIYTVSGGSITLDKPYSVIYVGLPMMQDLESLDLEAYFGETMLARRKRISRLSVYLYNTRTFFCGGENPDTNENNTNDDPLFELYEEKDGRSQATYDVAPELLTKQDYVIVPSRWTDSGRVFIRNVDPVPFSLLAMAPSSEDPVQTPYKHGG